MASAMWTPPGTMTTMSWPNSYPMNRRWGSSEMLSTTRSNSNWTYGGQVQSAFSQNDLVSLLISLGHVCLSVCLSVCLCCVCPYLSLSALLEFTVYS